MSKTNRFAVFTLAFAALVGLTACQQPAPPPPEPVPSAADQAATVAAANEAAAKRVIDEALSKGNIAVIDELFAPDFVEHQPFPPEVPKGVDGLKWFVENFRKAFPDVTIRVDQTVASGDLVATRATWKGTHQGEWMGLKPTGKSIEFESYDIIRFKDGKVVEHWGLDSSEQALSAAKNSK